MLGPPPPPPHIFVFLCFSMTPLLSSTNIIFEWPISDSLFYLFYLLLLHKVTYISNKHFFLFKCFSKESLLCSKVRATRLNKTPAFSNCFRVKVGATLSSTDVKFLLNQRREANFVIASFWWASIAVDSKSKWVCKGDC